ncbi:MAG: rhodanese-like domain-containing protein [Kiritimatiellia bacterium]
MSDNPQIPPSALPENHGYLLVDVREVSEWHFVHLPLSRHIPLGELPRRYQELPGDQKLLLLCHHGMRSQRAAEFLAGKGFTVANLSGGIDRWARERDPSLPRY